MALIDDYGKYTKSSEKRLQAMAEACGVIDAHGTEGDIVECGVWRGGNIILARKLSSQRVCWLYDTFAGITEPTAVDVNRGGRTALEMHQRNQAAGVKWDAASLKEVRGCLQEMDVLDDSYLRFVEGPVEQTLLKPENLPDKIALLRLDTDWYESTKIELEVLYPRLQSGGVLIVDDYGHWMGARKAVDDYFRFLPPTRWYRIDYTAVSMVKGRHNA